MYEQTLATGAQSSWPLKVRSSDWEQLDRMYMDDFSMKHRQHILVNCPHQFLGLRHAMKTARSDQSKPNKNKKPKKDKKDKNDKSKPRTTSKPKTLKDRRSAKGAPSTKAPARRVRAKSKDEAGQAESAETPAGPAKRPRRSRKETWSSMPMQLSWWILVTNSSWIYHNGISIDVDLRSFHTCILIQLDVFPCMGAWMTLNFDDMLKTACWQLHFCVQNLERISKSISGNIKWL